MILKIGRSLGLYPFMRAPVSYSSYINNILFPGYPWCIREVCASRDRYLTYIKAKRFVNNGGLVIFDRFYIPQIKLMDCPQIGRLCSNHKIGRFHKFLIRRDKVYYKSIMWPDLLILLKVDPEIAVQRKPEESAYSVLSRSKEIWDLDWRQTPAHVIDASKSKEEITTELKTLIWSKL
jgi:thymidylate kinase